MKLLRNHKGVTLAELLAVIALIGLIIGLIVGVQLYVQKQYRVQSEGSLQLTDITIAVKEITRDVRSQDIEEVYPEKIKFSENEYELVDEILQKNGANYIFDVDHFFVQQTENSIILEIRSKLGKEIKTELTLR